jgi:hypothetical protein
MYEGMDIYPYILDLVTSWKFRSKQLYAHRKGPWYPLDIRLGGPQDWSGG